MQAMKLDKKKPLGQPYTFADFEIVLFEHELFNKKLILTHFDSIDDFLDDINKRKIKRYYDPDLGLSFSMLEIYIEDAINELKKLK